MQEHDEIHLFKDEVQEARIQLFAHGYQPIPVRTRSKAPLDFNWQHMRGVPPFKAEAANTGVSAAGLRFIDVDIDDASRAARAEATVVHHLGVPPVRRGRSDSPKVALPYRALIGEPRKVAVTLPWFNADGKPAKIEMLGLGQQVVVPPSQHPDGALYDWRGGLGLHEVERWDLPATSEDQVRALVAELCGPEFGGAVSVGDTNGNGTLAGPARQFEPPSDEDATDAEAALWALPCDYPHDAWVKVAMSAYVAGVRYEVFLAWCRGHPKFKPNGGGERFCAAEWKSFRLAKKVTAATLFREVHERRPGWRKPSRGGLVGQEQTLPIEPSPLGGVVEEVIVVDDCTFAFIESDFADAERVNAAIVAFLNRRRADEAQNRRSAPFVPRPISMRPQLDLHQQRRLRALRRVLR